MNFNIAQFKAAYGKSNQIPSSDLPEIVFSGRSNVGKSSLINRILQRKAMARVSAKPGKTATINFFSLKEAYFVDLPGYGYAQVSQAEKKRWAELVEGYFSQDRRIALVVQICDIRHAPTADDMSMIGFLHTNGFPFIVALTKMDKLKKSQLDARILETKKILDDFGDIVVCPCSSEKGDGIDDIKKIIEDCVINSDIL